MATCKFSIKPITSLISKTTHIHSYSLKALLYTFFGTYYYLKNSVFIDHIIMYNDLYTIHYTYNIYKKHNVNKVNVLLLLLCVVFSEF